MFDPAKPWWLRALSLFHLWMLPFLVWLVRRTGYDRRGVWVQTALMTCVLLPASFLGATRVRERQLGVGTVRQGADVAAARRLVRAALRALPAGALPAAALDRGEDAAALARTQRASRPPSGQRPVEAAAGMPELTRPTARS